MVAAYSYLFIAAVEGGYLYFSLLTELGAGPVRREALDIEPMPGRLKELTSKLRWMKWEPPSLLLLSSVREEVCNSDR